MLLSPLRGLVVFGSTPPTACAVGCILPPLRGCVLANEGARSKPVRRREPVNRYSLIR